jgi:hypothetical protein
MVVCHSNSLPPLKGLGSALLVLSPEHSLYRMHNLINKPGLSEVLKLP